MWELVTKSVASSSPLEQSVLYLLILFSIVSWAIIFMKIKAIARAKKNNDAFMKIFDDARSVQNVSAPATDGPAPISAVYKAGMEAASQARILAVSHPDDYFDKIQQRMAHTCKTEFNTIRWGLGFLASVASASPFIGLFGTVWGIMSTFQNLGDAKSASLAVVAPGIAAALIATAMGLAVAIPAVMAYNALLAKMDALQETADMFIERVVLAVRSENSLASEPRAGKTAPAEKPAAAVAAGKGH
jgi:biopolymer transport protein ExbB/TolQ